VTIKVGDVGSLAKAGASADIEMKKLSITLSAEGEETITDEFDLRGHGGQTVTKTYEGLASLLKEWTLTAEARDADGMVIHRGSKSFIVPARDVIRVGLNLDARYSMLKANFNSIPDSVKSCELLVDDRVQADSSFKKQQLTGDTLTLSYDYLTASPKGTRHHVELNVYGEMWGFDTLLYTGDSVITVFSGRDARYALTLFWVGPGEPPPGAASITVILGAVGTVIFNAEFEDRDGLVDLVVSSFTLSPAVPTVHDPITFAAVVKNIGTRRAAASVLSLKVGGETLPAKYAVPMLRAGETYRVERTLILGRAQSYLARATADSEDDVAEANENNNIKELRFRVVDPTPVIQYTGAEFYEANGREWVRYRIPVVNYADFPAHLFVASPELPACGQNTSASRTWVDIYDASDDSRLYGFCALGNPADLQLLWFAEEWGSAPPEEVYITLTDRKTGAVYTSNTVSLREAAPQLEYRGAELYEANGKTWVRLKLAVSNSSAYSDDLFAASPELPPCGQNTSASRTWVDIYDESSDVRLYGFCALGSSDGLQSIWFAVEHGTLPPEKVYITMSDRLTSFEYRSNSVSLRYADPVLVYEGAELKELNGNLVVYYNMDVTNKSVYPAELFQAMPELPACGQNTNASRTWVDIYDASDDSRLYGFCALGSPANLGGIWFGQSHGTVPPVAVYIIMEDRLTGFTYRSNNAGLRAPKPVIAFKGTEDYTVNGVDYTRYRIEVVNRASYMDEMFAAEPLLPACGLNTSAARTWVDIFNGATDARLYGFCALGTADALGSLWFSVKKGTAPPPSVYITMEDRTMSVDYQSNTLPIP
jgi:hypothetical protein